MSRRALGSEQASQFSTNQSIVPEFGRALCPQATKKLIAGKLFQSVNKLKLQVKIRRLIGLQDSYQDRLVLFSEIMYDEFHVPDVLIVLANSQGH